MKERRGPDGKIRLWFEDYEIESITLEALTKSNLLPAPGSENLAVDMERFIEGHLRATLDRTADLDGTVLGVTYFERGKPPRIEINRDLTGSAIDDDDPAPGMLGRWRATLAHEAAHILFHRSLYELDDMQRGLFAAASDEEERRDRQRCLKRDVGYHKSGDWRELQANMGMAALLMPGCLFGATARAVLTDRTRGGMMSAGPAAINSAVYELASRFQVSRQAVRIRLETLGIVSPQGQTSLTL